MPPALPVVGDCRTDQGPHGPRSPAERRGRPAFRRPGWMLEFA